MNRTIFISLLLLLSLTLSACNLFDKKVEGYVGTETGGASVPGSPSSSKVGMAATASVVVFTEGGTTDAIIQLNRPLQSAATLNWTVENGTADFVTSSGTVNLSANDTSFRIPLAAVADGLYEGDETFNLRIEGDSSVFSTVLVVPLKIQETQARPSVSFENAGQSKTRSDVMATAKVRLSQASAFVTKVLLKTSGSATGGGVDYDLLPSDAVIFGPGETEKILTVLIKSGGGPKPLQDIVISLDRIEYGAAAVDSANNAHTILLSDPAGTGLFPITGITGGTDGTADGYLTNGAVPTVRWTNAANQNGYQVTIFENDGTTIKCAPVTTLPDVIFKTMTGCNLTEGKTYKASVVALFASGPSPASNDLFPFQVHTVPPTNFGIIGLMGGTDISPDGFLAGSLVPTIVWGDSTGENSYEIRVKNTGGTTICGPITVFANVTSVSMEGCTLTAGTSYKASVIALDAAGFSVAATNNDFNFTVTNSTSGYLILGVTGGLGDTTADDNMDDGLNPIINWQTALNASNYDVSILNLDNSVNCGPVNVSAATKSYMLAGCQLRLHDQYKVVVVAKDALNNSYPAANGPYVFRHRVGLYINGGGGSYFHGQTVTSCGTVGNRDACNAATPYEATAEIVESQIRVSNNGVISAKAWAGDAATVGNGILKITADYLRLDTNGSLVASGAGYKSTLGPGAGQSGTWAMGASYGGLSGLLVGKVQSPAYGNAKIPGVMGSGGGAGSGVAGGAGGGIIDLTVNTSLDFATGSIVSNGGVGGYQTGPSCWTSGGGGSGGSIYIKAANIGGSGANISSIGAGIPTVGCANSGGSGGRVSLNYDTITYTGGVTTLTANTHVRGGGAGAAKGASGTIYYLNCKDPLNCSVSPKNGYLIADNEGAVPHYQGVETPIPIDVFDGISTRNDGTFIVLPADEYLHRFPKVDFRIVIAGLISMPAPLDPKTLDIGPNGYFEWRRLGQVRDWDNIIVESGGVLTHTSNSNTETYKLDISTVNLTVLGKIDTDGRGYTDRSGPGGATIGGAAYGGMGSSGSNSLVYGDIRNPQGLGSAAAGAGSSGGGWIKIAADSLDISGGTLSAKGVSGGSGGTIFVNGNILKGTGGTLDVEGGANGPSNLSGGGGRIAVYYNDASLLPAASVTSLTFKTKGGSAGNTGASGTVFHKQNLETYGNLIVRNETNTYNEAVLTPLRDAGTFDSITTDTNGTVIVPAGLTVQLPSTNINYRLVMEGGFTLPGGASNMTIKSGGYLEWRQTLPLQLSNLTIESAGLLTSSTNSSAKQYFVNLDISNTLLIQGDIDVSRRGYASMRGPGAPRNGGLGAAYAGYGGSNNALTVLDSTPYGLADVKNPTEMGSGGNGSAGGGLVLIKALGGTGSVNLQGRILADGQGSGSTGGSGGSVYIQADSITGTVAGQISANGGSSGNSGSGGRIAVVVGTDSFPGKLASQIPAGNLRAYGGTVNYGDNRGGAAGSIYLKESTDTQGRVYYDNNNFAYASYVETPYSEGVLFDSISTTRNATLIVTSGQTVTLQSDTLPFRLAIEGMLSTPGNNLILDTNSLLEWRKITPMSFGDITIKTGATLRHTANGTQKSYALNINAANFDLQNGGLIDLDGAGYSAGNGPGASSGAGAHGGNSNSGKAYDSVIWPEDLGSGGAGANGGGALIGTISGTLTLNGNIRARGTNGTHGGAGGSIAFDTNVLAGSAGVLNVNGGNGAGGEGGAGGRIAVLYSSSSYTPNVDGLINTATAIGGTGAGSLDGGAGTIYYRNKTLEAAGQGHLVIRNTGRTYNEAVTTPLPEQPNMGTIVVDTAGAVEIPMGSSANLPTSDLTYRLILAGDVTVPTRTLNVKSGGVLEIRRGAPVTSIDYLTVDAGGLITHTKNLDVKRYSVYLKTVDFNLSGKVDVSARGYVSGYGSGRGNSVASGGAPGGSHAGLCHPATGSCYSAYDSLKSPADLGSAGGYSGAYAGGSGGGMFTLETTSATLQAGSEVRADGQSAASTGGFYPGGGAGGSINISATATLTANGSTLSANGGNGAGNVGGNGGGGRISLVYQTGPNEATLLSSNSISSMGGNIPTIGLKMAGAGTVYYHYKDSAETYGRLRIDNKGNPYFEGSETEIIQNDFLQALTVADSTTGLAIRSGVSFDMLTSNLDFPLRMAGTANFNGGILNVKPTGLLNIDRSTKYSLNSLTVESGGKISHSANGAVQRSAVYIETVGDLDLQSGSLIDVSAKGYSAGLGSGRAQSSGGAKAGGGAGHGGVGGGDGSTSTPGLTYGSYDFPTSIGSGGADGKPGCVGGIGGGAVRLKVNGQLSLNGQILANGQSASSSGCDSGGGGSGGSVFIETNVLAGNGTTGQVHSDGGGAPAGTSNHGGGGGGGRIAITVTTAGGVVPPVVMASGGTAYAGKLGSNGTVKQVIP
ncbi:Calx-beta domain-containing protein [Bdellovibrio svalbardensis]|uniref:Calx-beta domain-containing protein n=1 Tax=Bdellovibrio svalbardensis TaxID=2972972 RepID=A0ABT6DHV2_9BACT|nr:Calx-beta domain-containing protein [Bdellovibrio svalbardensis]MDG0815431.1 hypothetical protein [Bdellovibrio svalbardensis]